MWKLTQGYGVPIQTFTHFWRKRLLFHVHWLTRMVFFFFFFFVYRGASLLVVEACLSLFEQLAERGAIDFRRPFKRDCTIILFLHHFWYIFWFWSSMFEILKGVGCKSLAICLPCHPMLSFVLKYFFSLPFKLD
jgi:hypothetical protein